MANIPQEFISTFVLWIPTISLILNIGLTVLVMYLIAKMPRSHEVKTVDNKLAMVYKEAELHATELMKDATDKAKRIVEEASTIHETLKEKLEASVLSMSENLNKKITEKEEGIYEQFKNVFETISQSYQKQGLQLVDNFKQEGDTVVKTFVQTIQVEINSVREQIFGKIDTKMSAIEDEIEKYREMQHQKIDQNVQKIAKATIDNYLKNALSSEIQEQILFKSLDQFKKKNQN